MVTFDVHVVMKYGICIILIVHPNNQIICKIQTFVA